ncbi:hypothetical protein BDK51DRAFT_44977 [Blyttiomyces helicus]|uniref:Uncharacterized protein n=1 Tax=Blyttiomyces helicus TaxID=388810 RepID=A0A4V1ISM2_9FUNG|nr:hypothetical protein BDK51DRAFT_44977 [Blyttiomyces helicus]|eukprot:RKO94047.1 hypothetical protein BDK51DRAFT_44977 [Blyttiomyces helicus]
MTILAARMDGRVDPPADIRRDSPSGLERAHPEGRPRADQGVGWDIVMGYFAETAVAGSMGGVVVVFPLIRMTLRSINGAGGVLCCGFESSTDGDLQVVAALVGCVVEGRTVDDRSSVFMMWGLMGVSSSIRCPLDRCYSRQPQLARLVMTLLVVNEYDGFGADLEDDGDDDDVDSVTDDQEVASLISINKMEPPMAVSGLYLIVSAASSQLVAVSGPF